MKRYLKKAIEFFLGTEKTIYFNNFRLLCLNYWYDIKLYYYHSSVFKIDDKKKMECQIILDYHSVEKGLLFKDTKPRFAKHRIERLHKNLSREIMFKKFLTSQVKVGYQIMCAYYELHNAIGADISDYFSSDQYNFYKSIVDRDCEPNFQGVIPQTKDDFYINNNHDFYKFSNSRKSVRSFTGEKINASIIKQAITLSLNAPSVCNRQACKVYLLENKEQIDEALKIQGGMKGYTNNINQLLILTVNRNYFYTPGERNQFYIDGGVFLMNLLYSLHFYQIANCPANWGKNYHDEKKLEKVIKIPRCEKIICMIPIGIAASTFNVTLSKRRDVGEVFEIVS